ncbi:S-adenosyl-L-methionine-dependent methyltransferase [Dendrothele bispora CBS 962.96]|uniref:rRNA methyltransferase 2, mitochondrial n=1 Tax=Dendrothele bispora (strain CBS 962.96) TaxID=1314807 RepID=A0A4S8M7M8_DENBC|nr:S-adenosyl-L-methionine-dependent methyltransferase [Dendrothele bispora CBS 962.96]
MLRPTLPRFKNTKSKSSTVWLARQSRDPFVKQRTALSLPSRSAFKLLDMNEKYGNFLGKEDVRVVVDLGAAPGGWSRIVVQKLEERDGLLSDKVGGSDGKGKVGTGARREEEQGFGLKKTLLSGNDVDFDEFDRGNSSKRKGKGKHKEQNSKTPSPSLNDQVYDPLNIDSFFSSHSDFSSSSLSRMAEEHHAEGRPKVIAVDLLPIPSIPGVDSVQANFLDPRTEQKILQLIRGPLSTEEEGESYNPAGYYDSHGYFHPSLTSKPRVDVVLSDIAGNMTGNTVSDSEMGLNVCMKVWEFTRKYLRTAEEVGRPRGGVLVLKHFTHPSIDTFRNDILRKNFAEVTYVKPKASRDESREGYFVCRGFEPMPGERQEEGDTTD